MLLISVMFALQVLSKRLMGNTTYTVCSCKGVMSCKMRYYQCMAHAANLMKYNLKYVMRRVWNSWK